MRRMNPIAVFYHYRLSGGRPAISEPHAARIFAAQMEALGVSGLAEAASKVMAMAASVPDTMAAAPFLPAKTMSIALAMRRLNCRHFATSKSSLRTTPIGISSTTTANAPLGATICAESGGSA